MFIGLFLGICLTILVLFIKLYKNITLFSFKTMAFGIDFFVILFYSIYFFHPNVATKLVEGKLQYLLDAGVGILAVILYGLLILFINDTFPRVSNILNLFITFVGVGIAVPFTIGLLTPVIQFFHQSFTFNGMFCPRIICSLFLKYMVLESLPFSMEIRMSKLPYVLA